MWCAALGCGEQRAVAGRHHAAQGVRLPGWGLHSFTFQLNVSAFYGIGGAFRGTEGAFTRCQGV